MYISVQDGLATGLAFFSSIHSLFYSDLSRRKHDFAWLATVHSM